MAVQTEAPIAGAELAQIVEASVLAVFEMMVQVPVATEGWSSHDQLPPFDGVVGMVAIAGDWRCSALCHCDDELACLIGAKMLMAEVSGMDSEVLDGIGELANMIIGNVKDEFEKQTAPLQLGIPAVLSGKDFVARPGVHTRWVETRFDCDGRRISIWLSVEADQS